MRRASIKGTKISLLNDIVNWGLPKVAHCCRVLTWVMKFSCRKGNSWPCLWTLLRRQKYLQEEKHVWLWHQPPQAVHPQHLHQVLVSQVSACHQEHPCSGMSWAADSSGQATRSHDIQVWNRKRKRTLQARSEGDQQRLPWWSGGESDSRVPGENHSAASVLTRVTAWERRTTEPWLNRRHLCSDFLQPWKAR